MVTETDIENNNRESENSGKGQQKKPIVMALSGKIEPFIDGSDFESYLDRMELYFKANEIPEEKQNAWFITLAGEAIYDILKPLALPVKPSEKTFKEIKTILRGHFKPERSKRAERYKFHKIVQENGESISDYIVKLKSAAQTCKFGDFLDKETGENVGKYKLKILDESLTDRFIVGLTDEKIKSTLLNDETMEFEKCCLKAIQLEMVKKESKTLHPTSIKYLSKSRSEPKPNTSFFNKSQGRVVEHRKVSQYNNSSKCRRCGRLHDERTCPANNWKCFSCNKVGHVSTMCMSKQKFPEQEGREDINYSKVPLRKTSTNNLWYDSEDDENRRDTGNSINSIRSEVSVVENCRDELSVSVEPYDEQWVDQPLDYDVEVQSKKVVMECDCGAIVSVISLMEYNEKFSHIQIKPKSNDIPLRSVTGEKLNEVGTIEVLVTFLNKTEKVELKVIDVSRPFTALFGRNWLDVFIPNWREKLSTPSMEMIKTVSQSQSILNEIREKFPRIVFTDMETPIEGYKAELLMKEVAQPIFHCAYTIPYKLKEKVSSEIDRLVEVGILKPIKHSDWASPLVVRVKQNGELRFCIDGKVTVNHYLESDHYPLHRIDDIFASLSNCIYICVLDLKGAFKQLELSIKSKSHQQYFSRSLTNY